MRKTLTIIAVTLAAVVSFAAPAAACHPELAVKADCTGITITAAAWDTDDPTQRHNPDVRVLIDGAEVARGAFTAKAPSFVVSAKAQHGERVVRVVAVASWGPDGEHGDAGSHVEQTVTVPTCGGEYGPRITAAPRPTIVDAPAAPVVVPATTEVVHAEVAASSVVLEAQPPVLAFTGRSSWQTALAGLGLVVAGAGLVAATRRG